MQKLLFDIGANRGDATTAGLQKGYRVIAVEPAPRVYALLVSNFIYNPDVVPLKFAVSDTNNETIEFYEADEDGLSTMNKEWLTGEGMPYSGKNFRTISATTCTIDQLVEWYGEPDLIKIDVEGAEWPVLKGMTKKYGALCFEWTEATLWQHEEQLHYLRELGYTEFSLQYIEPHLTEPHNDEYGLLDELQDLSRLRDLSKYWWETEGWRVAGLRPTADVGMLWVR